MIGRRNSWHARQRRPRRETGERAHLGLDEAVLGARDEHEALDLEEVAQLRGVELPDGDRVALLVCAREQPAQAGDQREVGRCGAR